MAVSQEEFRQVLGRFASGVTVVTCNSDDGNPCGLTVSAFSSLSLEPPLVLICIDRRASVYENLKDGSYFAVNVLAQDQESVSRRFASRDADRFKGIGYREGKTGAPLIDGALACIECRVVSSCPGGDHTIFVGEVESSEVNDGKPLLYFRGGYSGIA